MTFFTKESVAFWKGLAKNNTKEWFDEHRKDYEKHLKAPYNALAAAICEQIVEVEPEYDTPPKQAVYRINRDIRFSKDKTPYKTELGLTVGRSEKHNTAWPAYTARLSVKGIWVAGGLYNPGTALRDHMRHYLGANWKELQKVEKASKKFTKTYGRLEGDAQKRPLKGLEDVVDDEPRVLNTQWVFWGEEMNPKLFIDPKLDQWILDRWEEAKPVQDWLKKAVSAYEPA